jgi:hypothetical protein
VTEQQRSTDGFLHDQSAHLMIGRTRSSTNS